MDLRKPKLGKSFHLNNQSGMSTYLSHINEIDDVIQSTEYKNLDIILYTNLFVMIVKTNYR